MSRSGGDLPDLNYFLNNGREDITREELTELVTVITEASFGEGTPKGCDGAALPSFAPEIQIESMEESPEPFPGFGEGSSLQDYGLARNTEPEAEIETTVGTVTPEPMDVEERPSCEGRVHKSWESPAWSDFDDGQPDHPDDCEHL